MNQISIRAILKLTPILGLIFQTGAPGVSLGAASQATKVFQLSDGMARVVFSPTKRNDKVEIYDAQGRAIGAIDWANEFEVRLSEDKVRESVTKDGIDLNRLLKGIGTVTTPDSTGNGKLMVQAKLPMTVTGYDGSEIKPGSIVYFGLERLAKEGALAPVAAWGGSSMGTGGATNAFNDKLLDVGVKGTPQSKSGNEVATKKARSKSKSKGQRPQPGMTVEGEVYIPRDSSVVEGQWTERPNGFLSSPTCVINGPKYHFSSEFGKRPSVKTTNGRRASSSHGGMDISCRKSGPPVLAAAAGCFKVSDMRFNRTVGYGISLKLDHGNGLVSQYAHMNNFMPEIREFASHAKAGDQFCVERGQQLGFIGATGNVTGPHLHFGVYENGKAIDPRKYLIPSSAADFSRSCSAVIAEADQLRDLDRTMTAQSSFKPAPGKLRVTAK